MRKLEQDARQRRLVKRLRAVYGTDRITFRQVKRMAVEVGYVPQCHGRTLGRMLVSRHRFQWLGDAVQAVKSK